MVTQTEPTVTQTEQTVAQTKQTVTQTEPTVTMTFAVEATPESAKATDEQSIIQNMCSIRGAVGPGNKPCQSNTNVAGLTTPTPTITQQNEQQIAAVRKLSQKKKHIDYFF